MFFALKRSTAGFGFSLSGLTLRGFTLVELLVIVVILGFLLSMMPRVFGSTAGQKRFEKTRQRMEEIKKAILGMPDKYYITGAQKYAGYVPDMAVLPALEDVLGTPSDTADDQPKVLWVQGKQISAYNAWIYFPGVAGWRGPYIEEPDEGSLKDAWGNPFVFKDSTTHPDEIDQGDMVIQSYGSDGLPGGGGFGQDITLKIRKTEYLAQVAGQAGEGVTEISIGFFRMGSSVDEKITELEEGDYFCFGARGPAEPKIPPPGRNYSDIPLGPVHVTCGYSTGKARAPFFVQPGLSWLGTMY